VCVAKLPGIRSRKTTGISRKVFANRDAAEAWFAENDPKGVAFEYEVLGEQP
jgi:hypothetical protein